ncbi:GntR family transcriptional regulator [Brevibacterium yomogidense]|uniref:GntR family transcriptional regulator n=1 Tax=Brevibacterium yomogidense TaxID=946573 RepID=UPI0018DFDD13|nr:GntR family transcriptional regulator [Brevibacterium yomogidense]
MALPRLDPPARVGDQVFEALHKAIMSGSYPAGHRLRIRDIAAEMGTSVMPVREAIRKLEELGLAESTPNRGAAVKGFTQTELLDVYAVRRLLEQEAATLGAARIDEAGVATMRAELKSLARAVTDEDVVAYLDADERLLTALYTAAGNPVLLETIQVLWQRCRSYKIVGADRELGQGDPEKLLSFQRELIDAASSFDQSRASRLTVGSVEAAMERIRTALPS